MTAYGTVETAVEAMKEGAYDFVTKPLKRARARRARCARRSRSGRCRSRTGACASSSRAIGEGEMIGRSDAMRALLDEVEQVAPSDATVLLTGESAPARAGSRGCCHRMSRRREGRLVAVNCAALPETLLESELFGYEKGAFTGAVAPQGGPVRARAAAARCSSTRSPRRKPAVQVKLLRVLQEGEYERVGGTETLQGRRRASSPPPTATSTQEVAAGRFREDLFYRLNVIPMHVPPLRDRREDVPLLAQHFLVAVLAQERQGRPAASPTEALEALTRLPLAGQRPRARERDRARGGAVPRASGSASRICRARPRAAPGSRKRGHVRGRHPAQGASSAAMIEETLRYCGGDKNLAASLMGITSRTIYRREAEWADDEEGGPR